MEVYAWQFSEQNEQLTTQPALYIKVTALIVVRMYLC